MPSVSRNHATVSVTLGDESTPWPMRWIDVGDLPRRITRPTRRPGSRAVFCSSRATLIGSTRDLSCHDLDLVAVGLGEAHALAAARFVQRLDAGSAGQLREALQVVLVGSVIGEADELRAALVCDMQMMVVVGAAHVERGGCALGAGESEMGEELLHLVEVGRLHPGPGEFRSLDYGHCLLRILQER